MCLVAYKERDTISLHKLSEIHWASVKQEIVIEGIFVFGGVKGETPDVRITDTNLYMLTIGTRNH